MQDANLYQLYKEAVAKVSSEHMYNEEILRSVHDIILKKIYNARCNEFLKATNKLNCMKESKVVDANVMLRDHLKSYVSQKKFNKNYDDLLVRCFFKSSICLMYNLLDRY